MPLKDEYNRIHSIPREKYREIFEKVKEEILRIENVEYLNEIK